MGKVKDLPNGLITPVDPAPSVPEANASKVNGSNSAVIEVPICRETPEADFCLHIDTRLSLDQSNAIRKAAAALDRQQARLSGGKRVVNPTDAVKFMLERLAAVIES